MWCQDIIDDDTYVITCLQCPGHYTGHSSMHNYMSTVSIDGFRTLVHV